MQLSEIIVSCLLLVLFFKHSVLKTPIIKIGFVCLVAYLAHENLLLGCFAAVVLLRALQTTRDSWSPPRIDQLGLANLLRPQESFFKPVLRTPSEPVAELAQPYTPF